MTSHPHRLALVSLALLASAPASADRGGDHAATALRLYQDGRYAAALERYVAAYQGDPDPNFLFGAARCHHKLGQWDKAVEYYEAYLAAETGDAEGLASAREHLDEVRRERNRAAAGPRVVPGSPGDKAVPSRSSAAAAARPAAPPATTAAPGKRLFAPSDAVSATAPEGAREAIEAEKEWYRSWWIWTAAGGVAAGAVVTFFVLSGGGGDAPAAQGGSNAPVYDWPVR